MRTCSKILFAAVASVSVCTFAIAAPDGGSQNQAGGSDSAARTSTGGDASGSVASDQTRDMQRGAAAGGADAQLVAQLEKIATMPEKAGDALFVLGNAKGNLFEVEFAKLAQKKSQDPQVKELAKMIETDHSAANEKLKGIATKMGLEVPSSLPSEKQKMLAVFSAMSPTDFDTCYLLDNKAVHAKDIVSFSDHQKSVKDEELRAYIAMVLPKLKEHGSHIETVAAAKGFPTKMSDAMGSADNSVGRSMTGGHSGGHTSDSGAGSSGAGSTGSGASGSGASGSGASGSGASGGGASGGGASGGGAAGSGSGAGTQTPSGGMPSGR